MNGRANLRAKFFDYSTSREYFIKPDVVEYKDAMGKPGFDLILGSNTMKAFRIVLDFRTKEITLDEISLPMREINKLSTRAQIEKSWSLNNRKTLLLIASFKKTPKNLRAPWRPPSA